MIYKSSTEGLTETRPRVSLGSPSLGTQGHPPLGREELTHSIAGTAGDQPSLSTPPLPHRDLRVIQSNFTCGTGDSVGRPPIAEEKEKGLGRQNLPDSLAH